MLFQPLLLTGKAHNIAYIKELNTSFTFLILEHHLKLLHSLINPVLMNPDKPCRIRILLPIVYPQLFVFCVDGSPHIFMRQWFIDECSAIFVFILFSSFVLAYPTSLKNKAIGQIFGIPSLFVVNTLHLAVVFLAGLWRPDLFEHVHVYLWQTIEVITDWFMFHCPAGDCWNNRYAGGYLWYTNLQKYNVGYASIEKYITYVTKRSK